MLKKKVLTRRPQGTLLAPGGFDRVDDSRNLPAFIRLQQTECIDAAVTEISVSVKVIGRPDHGDSFMDENFGFPDTFQKALLGRCDTFCKCKMTLIANRSIVPNGKELAFWQENVPSGCGIPGRQDIEELVNGGDDSLLFVRWCFRTGRKDDEQYENRADSLYPRFQTGGTFHNILILNQNIWSRPDPEPRNRDEDGLIISIVKN